jgi:hypothetical protein
VGWLSVEWIRLSDNIIIMMMSTPSATAILFVVVGD